MDNKAVFERLFNKNFFDSANRQMLETISNEHPYFAVAQFYLLRQTISGTEDFSKQAAKTAVLFNNPHWLNFQLQQTGELPVAIEQSYDQASATYPQPETGIKVNNDIEDDTAQIDSGPPMTFELKLPAENLSEQSISFEPMHLVDYFASQGIKLSEQQPNDKLGRQMKSFTEWLKTMKKLPGQGGNQSAIAGGIAGEQADLTIQALADKSNQEQDVITEAMALVLASQGKGGKAIELYQKLSLMNPSKSAYFAAKIEQLKAT